MCLWYTSEIKHQKGVVRWKEKIWQRYREDHQWIAYKVEERKYNAMLLESKQTTIADKVILCNEDAKQLFRLANEITSSTKYNPLPDRISNQELADQFVDYFINKIQLIRNSLKNYDKYHTESTAYIPTLDKFEPLMEDEVAKIVMDMASPVKSDLVPTTLLKKILPQVIRPITEIINTSLEFGIFASQWKVALLKPLLNKIGLALFVSKLPSCQQLVLRQQGPQEMCCQPVHSSL